MAALNQKTDSASTAVEQFGEGPKPQAALAIRAELVLVLT